MPRPPAASSPSPTPLPEADLAGACATLGVLPEAAIITRDQWERGGIQFVFANAPFSALTGYTATELMGQNTRLLHGPKTDMAPLPAGKEMALLAQGENWLHRKNGDAFCAAWRFRPLQPGYLVGVFQDITETKRIREAMIHSQKLATVGQLTGGVAHDLNNLLSIINGYCEILAGKLPPNSAPQKDLREIHRAGTKATRIARQILEFSRRQETEVRVVNLNLLIREIADILHRVMGENVTVELRLASDLGNARIDPTQFQQVLLNLCLNARDAMTQGGKLKVRSFNRKLTGNHGALTSGDYVGLEVTDTGSGIDDATRARLFESFFTTKSHGTGFGLAMAHHIVTSAHGSISARSIVGSGTTFEILLPETAEPAQFISSAAPSLRRTHGSETLWVIEADEVLRKMVSGMLAVDGYQVHSHADTASALAAIGQQPTPQLVLLDCTPPAALKLLRELQKLAPQLLALIIAAEKPDPARLEINPRALRHLPKPFALSALLRAVRTLLDSGGK